MKQLLIAMIFLLSSQVLGSRCGSGMSVFPEGESISTDGHIIIEAHGAGGSHEMLRMLGDKYSLYLKSIDGPIQLIKKSYKRGQKSWSQALFVAEKELQKGRTYTLAVKKRNPNDLAFMEFSNVLRNKVLNRARWKADQSDNYMPKRGKIDIVLESSGVTSYGCGPAVENVYHTNPNVKNGSFLLTQIFEVETGKVFEYYAINLNNKLRIGHGMCSGAYRFRKDYNYKIRFIQDYLTTIENTIENTIEWEPCPNPWGNAAQD